MRLASVWILACVLGVGALCIGHAGAAPIDKATKAIAGDNNAFAIDLYGELSKAEGNLFFSPFSISTALGMTYAGAKGQTADQMAKTLHFTLPQDHLHSAFNRLDLELAQRGQGAEGKDEGGFRLHIVNAIWGQQGTQFLDDFLDTLAENYGAGLRLLDFRRDPETARVTINDWISEQTEGKIEDLIPPGAIDTLTRLVLTNAIYFNAAWAESFDKDMTHRRPLLSARRQPGHGAHDEAADLLPLRRGRGVPGRGASV